MFEVHSCLSCDIEIPDRSEFQLCDECRQKFDIIKGNVCLKCGEKLSDDNPNIKFCDSCHDKEYHFDRNFSFSYYTDVSADIVKKFKYGGRKYYAKFIAGMMLKSPEIFKDVDIITYVPISRKRRRERGFNQAEEMAKELAKATGIEVMELLVKSKDGKNQAKLNQAERLKNLAGSFSAKSDGIKLTGKNILIIDDVFTTGTTLDECSKVLRKLKPKKIYTYTFAKTDFNVAKI